MKRRRGLVNLLTMAMAMGVCAGSVSSTFGGVTSGSTIPTTVLRRVLVPPIPPIAKLADPEESLFLDTYALTNEDQVVTTAMVLVAGKTYRVDVMGTFSIWYPGVWERYVACDPAFPPEPHPMFPSPVGPRDGPVGLDAQFFFSSLIIGGVCQGGFPLPSYFPRNFEVCLDGSCSFESTSWHSPGWGRGDYTDYRPDHAYVFWVVGEGQRLSARRPDLPLDDNYGRLWITVREVSFGGEVQDLINLIVTFPPAAFEAPGLNNALINQYNKLFARIDVRDYCGAVETIDVQILRRINGANPPADARDWIVDPWRAELLAETIELRKGLIQLAGGDCP